jgi:hypothetical protein
MQSEWMSPTFIKQFFFAVIREYSPSFVSLSWMEHKVTQRKFLARRWDSKTAVGLDCFNNSFAKQFSGMPKSVSVPHSFYLKLCEATIRASLSNS